MGNGHRQGDRRRGCDALRLGCVIEKVCVTWLGRKKWSKATFDTCPSVANFEFLGLPLTSALLFLSDYTGKNRLGILRIFFWFKIFSVPSSKGKFLVSFSGLRDFQCLPQKVFISPVSHTFKPWKVIKEREIKWRAIIFLTLVQYGDISKSFSTESGSTETFIRLSPHPNLWCRLMNWESEKQWRL